MTYLAKEDRYSQMTYNYCGSSGLRLSAVSLGLWHSFGAGDNYDNCRDMLLTAFDLGINHFDLANNYGVPAGSAETTFGRILSSDLAAYRDELCIATKAGHYMWPGPYGDGGSKKYLLSSLDQSLRRMQLDYVDIFYHHRPDPNTPMEETADALEHIVASGRALYVGLSKYYSDDARAMYNLLNERGIHCLVEQVRHSMLVHPFKDDGLFQTLKELGMGSIVFSPLAGGLLTDRYLNGIPSDSRAQKSEFLKKDEITPELVDKVSRLNDIAQRRGQSMAQMAMAWAANEPSVASILIGASRPGQIVDNVRALVKPEFSDDELNEIETILAE
ncbi:MAG: aldo/keto reductase [Sedimentisphaerales bacterium]|nr:aldo/keto reductase [Sedimentisphaerales bacterium]MBN2841908.1 aldo/keto reductase [Sedimentisphaerales bacterium]